MRISRKSLLLTALLPALWTVGTSANAELLFSLQRVSDTRAILTGTGSAGTSYATGVNVGRFFGLILDGGFFQTSFGPFQGEAEQTSGNFNFGQPGPVLGWFDNEGDMLSGDTVPAFYNEDVPSGSSVLDINPSNTLVWRDIGTSGNLLSRHFRNDGGVSTTDVVVGRWQVTAVPEPGTLALAVGGLGLAGLFQARRRPV